MDSMRSPEWKIELVCLVDNEESFLKKMSECGVALAGDRHHLFFFFLSILSPHFVSVGIGVGRSQSIQTKVLPSTPHDNRIFQRWSVDFLVLKRWPKSKAPNSIPTIFSHIPVGNRLNCCGYNCFKSDPNQYDFNLIFISRIKTTSCHWFA